MKAVFNKAKNFKEAFDWEIEQELSMTHKEREKIALILKRRVYGCKNKDVREWYKNR